MRLATSIAAPPGLDLAPRRPHLSPYKSRKPCEAVIIQGFARLFPSERIMPIYAYRCETCGFAKDVLQKMSDDPLTHCPECGKDSFRKQVTAAGFQLKGSGWYVTDFRGGSGGTSAPAAGAAASAAPAAASSGEGASASSASSASAGGESSSAPAASCGGGCACH